MTGQASCAPVLVLIGVSGSGKSTIGRLLAERLGRPFLEGDDLHPAANVAKMRAGVPLTDDDRVPWLDRISSWMGERLDGGECAVVSCSALKRAHRDRLARSGVAFVHLTVDRETLRRRLSRRRGHFMPADLLDSQIEALEEPEPDEAAVPVDACGAPEDIVERVLELVCVETSSSGEDEDDRPRRAPD